MNNPTEPSKPVCRIAKDYPLTCSCGYVAAGDLLMQEHLQRDTGVEPTNTDAELSALAHRLYSKGYDDGAGKYVRANVSTAYLSEDEAVAAILAYTHRYHIAGLKELCDKAQLSEQGEFHDYAVSVTEIDRAIEAEEKKL